MKKKHASELAVEQSPAAPAIEAYIASVSEPARSMLVALRATIRSAAPKDAIEVISYGMPAFAWPRPFFGYAAFKKHVSVFPFSGSFLDGFGEELKGYARTRSSLHLALDKPVPGPLIRKLVRSRVAILRDGKRR